jgi:hypothetical protein
MKLVHQDPSLQCHEYYVVDNKHHKYHFLQEDLPHIL